METEHQDDISFYTEQVYRQLQKNYPEFGITEEEIENVSHLAPIHDIGKIRVPIEILNKNGKLTIDEMEVVKQHPITGAEMTLRFPNGMTTEKLNKYSYEICRHHHERFDGSGYPDGLKGDQIPLCAQVVGLVDAYDALVSERPYKRKLKHAEAVRMIVNAECGAFSMKLLQCFCCGYAKRVGAESRIKQRRVRKKPSRYLMKMKEILTDIIIKLVILC